jgi:hypothetical protein
MDIVDPIRTKDRNSILHGTLQRIQAGLRVSLESKASSKVKQRGADQRLPHTYLVFQTIMTPADQRCCIQRQIQMYRPYAHRPEFVRESWFLPGDSCKRDDLIVEWEVGFGVG